MSCLENYRLLAVSSVTLVWRVRVVLAIILPACFHLVLGPGLVRAGIKIEFALHRPSTTQFFFDYDEGAPIVDRTLFYGAPNDIALLADFDGDTIVDLALYRDGIWFINLMNDGRMTDCRGSTHGLQPYLIKAFLNKGGLIMDNCHVEGFSGFEGKMKLGKVSGIGTVTLRDSGQASDLDISGDITVKVS